MSMGAILHELITGEAAFSASTQIEKQEQIESEHFFSARRFAHANLEPQSGIAALLESLLARSPAERFSDPIALRQALRAQVAFPPALTVCPQFQSPRETQSCRRRPFHV